MRSSIITDVIKRCKCEGVELARCVGDGGCRGRVVGGTYPHALHATHGPERSERAKGSHRFERLNASGATKRRYEVYKRDLMKSTNAF